MQKKKTVMVCTDRLSRIAAALKVMGHVQLQFHIPWISGAENLVQLFRTLTECSHVVVIAECYAQVGGALAKFGQQAAQSFVVGSTHGSILRPLVGYLKIESVQVVHKLRVGRVFGQFISFHRRINMYTTAGERNHGELMFLQQILELAGAAEFLDHICPQLNPVKAQIRDVIYGLPVVSVPCDGGVSQVNLRRSGADRSIEIRKVRRWIKRRLKKCPGRH